VDWAALGLDPAKATLYAPSVAGVQLEALFRPAEGIPLPAGRGLLLVLDETPRQVARVQDLEAQLTDAFLDAFSAPALTEGWRIHKSGDGVEVLQQAGALRIVAPANRVGGIERDLPPGVRAVEVQVEPGTDQGKTWGCGVALVWPGGKSARVNLRVPESRFGTLGSDGIRLLGGPLDATQPQTLRLLLTDSGVIYQVKTGDEWATIDAQSRTGLDGDPALLRVGKLGESGDWQDYGGDGEAVGACAVWSVRVRSMVGG